MTTTYKPQHYIGGPVDRILYTSMLTAVEQQQFRDCMKLSGIKLERVYQVFPRVMDTCVFDVEYLGGTKELVVLRGELPEWWMVPSPEEDFNEWRTK